MKDEGFVARHWGNVVVAGLLVSTGALVSQFGYPAAKTWYNKPETYEIGIDCPNCVNHLIEYVEIPKMTLTDELSELWCPTCGIGLTVKHPVVRKNGPKGHQYISHESLVIHK